MARGNEKRCMFRDDRDRKLFLELLGEAVTTYKWILSAYVLMSNHVHLVIELTMESLSKGMQWLDGEYARRFNERHARVGHLFQGRFKSKLIEKEAYFLELLRYVALNPVRAQIVPRPEDFRWSSHRAVLGLTSAPPWLAVDDVLVQFGPDRDLARAVYRGFVDAAIGVEQDIWKNLVGGTYLGSDDWIAGVRKRIEFKPRSREHPRAEILIGRPSMADVVAGVAESLATEEGRIRNGPDRIPRMIAAWIGRKEALLTGPEIAKGLSLRSAGHVSVLVARCEQELKVQPAIQDCVDRCLSTIRRKSTIEDLTPSSSS